MSAANGIGKTTAGAVELICYATGWNPWRKEKYPTPNLTWAVPLDRDKLGLVMRAKLQQFLPKGTRYNKLEQMYTLPPPWNSRIQVIQQAAGREQFQGARIRAAWVDEECPASQGGAEVFTEIMARKEPGQDLDIHYTLTPLNGFDWSWRKILDEKSEDRFPGVEVFYASIEDAAISHGGFYTDEEIEEIKNKYPEHERSARLTGHAGLLSSSIYFNQHAVNRLWEIMPRGEKVRLKSGHFSAINVEADETSHLIVYEKPQPGRQYIIGADPGGGVGRDSSVAIVFDRATLKCAALYSNNRVDPDYFGAETLRRLGMYFNEALLVVESNNHGGTVLSLLRGIYPNLYVRQDLAKYDHRSAPEYGFRTDTRSRPRILDAVARALRDELWSNVPEQLLSEMRTFVVREDMKIEAMPGYFDDCIMAAGIALCVNYENPPGEAVRKEDYRIKLSGVTENAPAWMAS